MHAGGRWLAGPWRQVLIARVCVAVLSLFAILGWQAAASATPAVTAKARSGSWGWSPAVVAKANGFVGVVFDRHDVPWTAYMKSAKSSSAEVPFVARLSGSSGLSDVRRVPSLPGTEARVQALVLDSRNQGVLLLEYDQSPEGVPESYPSYGLATVAWRPGAKPATPRVLIEPPGPGNSEPSIASSESSIAIDSHARAIVVWRTNAGGEHPQQTIEVARLVAGELRERQLLATIPRSQWAYIIGAWPARGESLEVAWQLHTNGPIGEEGQPVQYGPVGIVTAQTNGNGVFSAVPLSSPWPAPEAGAKVEPLRLVSDARGDQVIAWLSGPPSSPTSDVPSRPANLYVASRDTGGQFGPGQLIGTVGTAPYEGGPVLAVGPTGRITVVWQSTPDDIYAAAGQAGAQIGPAHQIASNVEHPDIALTVTTRDRAIAVWTNGGTGKSESVIEAATSSDGADFTKPQVISRTNADIDECRNLGPLVPDRAGGALASWGCSSTNHGGVTEYSRYAGGR